MEKLLASARSRRLCHKTVFGMIASTQTNDSLATVKTSAKGAEPVESACAKLKAAGLRITRPRLAILSALIARREPASIEQIHEELGPERCDLVTVYRCMAAFEEIQLVRRTYFLNGTSLYEIDLGKSARYHVVCKNARRVDDIDEETTVELTRVLQGVEEILRTKGYTEVSHVVEFIGMPPAPAARPKPETASA
jgi:Fur family ferric uptake transcriptional regulator